MPNTIEQPERGVVRPKRQSLNGSQKKEPVECSADAETSHVTEQSTANAVANKQDYLARLKLAIEHLHKCVASWRESVSVKEVFQGETLWNGDVEVFDLTGHPKAKRAYGWSHPDGVDNKTERFVAVLDIPPVTSPETAVKISIYSDIKKGKLKPSNP